MHEINCPHCQKPIALDATAYADIITQVRDNEFTSELADRLAEAEKDKANAVEIAELRATAELERVAAAKDLKIGELNSSLEASELAKAAAVISAQSELVKERDSLKNEIDRLAADKKSTIELVETKVTAKAEKQAAAKDAELQKLRSKLEAAVVAEKLAVSEAVRLAEVERNELTIQLERVAGDAQVAEAQLTQRFESEIRERDDQIERLRDMKLKLSTKMVGETLEQHCDVEFNRIRATAFPRAYFEKDNDARSGSKGDFIFRDFDEQGNEVVSIMFEMKNESDGTASKQKNEDFLKELDKDRIEKGCDYAVLVSMLEPDSELYNLGIVDVSHRFPKMYVVRPQFFIPIITLLRNASSHALVYKAELEMVKAQNIDVTNFESGLDEFKSAFGKNYELASRCIDLDRC